jgi:hypothetical protein
MEFVEVRLIQVGWSSRDCYVLSANRTHIWYETWRMSSLSLSDGFMIILFSLLSDNGHCKSSGFPTSLLSMPFCCVICVLTRNLSLLLS